MGGYLATRWAQLHPERVDRLFLLCPGFGMLERWDQMLGEGALARWKERGHWPFLNAAGEEVGLHWEFIENASQHPSTPAVPCPTVILHGAQDEVVPIGSSRRYAQAHSNATLIEVEDNHGLVASVGRIEEEVLSFWHRAG